MAQYHHQWKRSGRSPRIGANLKTTLFYENTGSWVTSGWQLVSTAARDGREYQFSERVPTEPNEFVFPPPPRARSSRNSPPDRGEQGCHQRGNVMSGDDLCRGCRIWGLKLNDDGLCDRCRVAINESDNPLLGLRADEIERRWNLSEHMVLALLKAHRSGDHTAWVDFPQGFALETRELADCDTEETGCEIRLNDDGRHVAAALAAARR